MKVTTSVDRVYFPHHPILARNSRKSLCRLCFQWIPSVRSKARFYSPLDLLALLSIVTGGRNWFLGMLGIFYKGLVENLHGLCRIAVITA